MPFLLLGAVAYAPVFLVGLAQPAPTRMSGVEAWSAMSIVAALLGMVMQQILTSAMTYGVVQQLVGRPAPVGEMVAKGCGAFGRTFLTALLVGLAVFVGTLLLVAPGIWCAIMFSVSIPVAVVERMAGAAALRRSKELVQGNGVTVFLVYLVLVVLLAIAGGILGAVVGGIFGVQGWAFLILNYCIQVVGYTLCAAIFAVLYVQLRRGRESIDAQQIAAVFG